MLTHEFKQHFQQKWAVAVTVLLPLVLIWFCMQAFSPMLFSNRFSQKFEVALVDEDNTAVSRLMANQFENADYMKNFVTVRHTDFDSAMRLLQENQISGIIRIPQGFITSIYQGENKPFILIGNPLQPAASELIKNQLTSAANLLSAGQTGVITVWKYTQWGGGSTQLLEQQYQQSVYQFTINSVGRNKIFEQTKVSAIPNVTPPEYFTAALVVVFVAFFSIRGMKTFVQERQSGIQARFRASPMPLWQFIAAKFTASFLLLYLQLLLIVVSAGLLFNNYFGGTVWSWMLVTAATAFSAAAWSIFVASLAKTPQAVDLIGYLGTLLVVVLGGNIYPLIAFPDSIKILSHVSFTYWSMSGFLQLFSGQTTSLGFDAAMLFAIGGILLVCAGTMTRFAWRH